MSLRAKIITCCFHLQQQYIVSLFNNVVIIILEIKNMSIQKSKLIYAAIQLASCIQKLNDIAKQKQEFTKKINYQVNSLFSLISNHPTLSSRQLAATFSPAIVRLLIQNKKYMTVQDLCAYLGVSETKTISVGAIVNKNNTVLKDHRQQIQSIMEKQVQILEQIKQTLKIEPYQMLFNEIDFFNNGYIDATSFHQFVQHYCSEGDLINSRQNKKTTNGNASELRCMKIIKYLKGSATAQKIFFVDFCSIFQDAQSVQNQQHSLSIANNSLALSRSAGHIARVSDLQLIHSRNKKIKSPTLQSPNSQYNLDQSQLNAFTVSNNGSHLCNNNRNKILILDNEGDISTIKPHRHYEIGDLDRINKTVTQSCEQVTYEDKICENHWRNARYLQKLKAQTSVSNLKPAYTGKSKQQIQQLHSPIAIKCYKKYKQSFFPSSSYSSNTNPQTSINISQILYQLRYICQLYQKHRKQLQTLIVQNPHFTIINAFNVIDYVDRGYVTMKQLREFVVDAGVVINTEKINGFYHIIRSSVEKCVIVQDNDENNQQQAGLQNIQIIMYADFAIKVFKLRSIENLYTSCRKRKPLVSQEWPQQQKKNYCRFIRSIISIFSQIKTAKYNLLKMFNLTECKDRKQQQKQMGLKMEEVFKQSEIHYDKFRQIVAKNSDTLIGELYGQEVILEPAMLLNFLLC